MNKHHTTNNKGKGMKKLMLAALLLPCSFVSLTAMEVPARKEETQSMLEIANNSGKDIVLIIHRSGEGSQDRAPEMRRLNAGKRDRFPQREDDKIVHITAQALGAEASEVEEIAPYQLSQLVQSSSTISITSAGGNKLSYTVSEMKSPVKELARPLRKKTIQVSYGTVQLTEKKPVTIETPLIPKKGILPPQITKIINLSESSSLTFIASYAPMGQGISQGTTLNGQSRTIFSSLGGWPELVDLTKKPEVPIGLVVSGKSGIATIIIEGLRETTLYQFSTEDLNELKDTLGSNLILTIDKNKNISFKADPKL